MPEYLTPGVYIEEIERGPRPIEGVPTSTAAFLGETERGPIAPRLVTSYGEYVRWFGGIFGTPGNYMPYAVSGFFENGGRRLYVCRIVGENATKASKKFGIFSVEAVGVGAWGKKVWATIKASTTEIPDPENPGQKKPIGFRLMLAYWSSVPPGFEAFNPFDPDNQKRLPRPALTEDFDDLVTDPNSSDYFDKRLKDNSALAELIRDNDPDPTKLPEFDEGVLDQGEDGGGNLGKDDYEGETNGQRNELQGLKALELDPYRDVALVYAPTPRNDANEIVKAVITHCEKLKFRFAVVDSEENKSDVSKLDPRTNLTDSQYAAFYYPWIQVSDPQNGTRRKVPPGGHVLGVYARTDIERGVFKAPANEILRGVVELEFDIDDGKQAQLNPRGVNVTRQFPGRGIRVWGARTLSSNGLWKYVSVRRLFIFLERSIYEGTQWVVFEPNDERLWARVKDTIRLFLRTQWRLGALMGTTEEQAFFITCDRSTMTQDDILNGRLVCEIGIAPVRPAEFVIFRIFQHTAEPQR